MTIAREDRWRAGAAAGRRAAGALLLPLTLLAARCGGTEPKQPDAPNDGGGPPDLHPAVGVCFYDAPAYEGARHCIELTTLSTDVVNLASSKDGAASALKRGIASVEIFGQIEVKLYHDELGQGESVVLAASSPTLPEALTGQVASFEIDDIDECRIHSGGCDVDREACTNALDGHSCTPLEVCFYAEPGQAGEKWCSGPTAGAVDLPDELDDAVSSISIEGPAVVTVYKDPGAQGFSFATTKAGGLPSDFDDAISSLSVSLSGLDELPSATECKAPQLGSSAPARLSDTGCFRENPWTGAYTVPAPELLPYDVNVSAWTDGALASRWMVLPVSDGRPVPATIRADDGVLNLAPGAMLWQELKRDGRRLETRLLVRSEGDNQDSRGWGAYTYVWREDQQDADLVLDGMLGSPADPTWYVPRADECARCHAGSAGPEVKQLDRAKSYPPGRTGSQLDTLLYLGMITYPESIDSETARFRLDEGAGGVVSDPARPFVEGRIEGSPSWLDDPERPGGAGWALSFDGATWVRTTVPNASTRTLAAWIRPATSDPVDYIESVIDSDVAGRYGTGFGVNDGKYVAILDNEFWYTDVPVKLDQWQHVALAFDARSAALYVDGERAATLSYLQGEITSASYVIGRSNANELFFHGEIADVRIFSGVLGADNVQRVFQGEPIEPVPPPKSVALPDPFDDLSVAPLDQRARSWLHANCSRCHQPGGEEEGIDLRFDTLWVSTNLCDVEPRFGTAGITEPTPRLVAPGKPERSVLLARIMSTDEAQRMPPVACRVVDSRGVDLITRWIASLRGC